MSNLEHQQYLESLRDGILRDAEALINADPIMQVAGTLFDVGERVVGYDREGEEAASGLVGSVAQLTRKSSSVAGDALQRKASLRVSTNSDSEASQPLNASSKRRSFAGGSSLRQQNLLRRATPLKAAAMWEVGVINLEYHRCLMERFRVMRLRAKLERFLLPILVRRRTRAQVATLAAGGGGTTPSTVGAPDGGAAESAGSTNAAAAGNNIGGERPTGQLLLKCCPWIAAMNDLDFAEEVARLMQKYTKLLGDDVVKAGDSSQGVLYVTTVGKFEWVTPSASSSSPSLTASPSFIGGAGGGSAPLPASAATVGSTIVFSPLSFGDVFGGPSKYQKSLFARSRGVVYYISKSTFDGLLESWYRTSTKEAYEVARRAEMLATLKLNYPLTLSRMPLMRRMPADFMRAYFDHFQPVVFAMGHVLFSEGATAGPVYVLCDGAVTRSRVGKGDEQTTTQTLAVAGGADFPGKRYAFLGEEPHILPEKLRHTCTVASEVMKGYVISATLFPSILLDDARLLLRLREEILLRRASTMRLKVEALRQVPLLQDFPLPKLQALLGSMTPKVVERSTLICQSQQALREIFLVVRGDIRDPRRPGIVPPTLPQGRAGGATGGANAAPGSPQSPESARESGAGGGGGGSRERALEDSLPKNLRMSFSRSQSFARPGTLSGGSLSFVAASTANATGHISVREEDDLNPPLPATPCGVLLYALGGLWEGLLSEKWSCTWEATTVVEMWVLPTAALRSEYNDLPRGLQANILHQLRVNQMKDLGLSEVPQTKLPPMTIYRTGAESVAGSITTFANAADAAGARQITSRSQHRRSTKGSSSKSHKRASGDGGKGGSAEGSVAAESSVSESHEASTSSQESKNHHHSGTTSSRKANTHGEPHHAAPSASSPPASPKRTPNTAATTATAPASARTTGTGVRAAGGSGLADTAATVASPSPNALVLRDTRPDCAVSPESELRPKPRPDLVGVDDPTVLADIAEMRRAAQERNRQAQKLRKLPLDVVIQIETTRLVRGEHKFSDYTLPPLVSREDRLYFGVPEEDEAVKPGARVVKSARSTTTTTVGGVLVPAPPSPPPQTSNSASKQAIPWERMQRFYAGQARADEASGSGLEDDKVIRSLPLSSDRPMPPRDGSRGPWSARIHPPPASLEPFVSAHPTTRPSPRRAGGGGSADEGRRWFQEVPERGGAVQCKGIKALEDSDALDVMIRKTLENAEAHRSKFPT